MIRSKSYAKINLSLELLNKRNDGFHNILSIMQTISLHDDISVGLSDEITIDTNVESLKSEDNLIYIAAKRMQDQFNIDQGVHIELIKNIPLASGLGGGSSNAATVIMLLKKLWKIECSNKDLFKLASELGSDVPFFLTGGTVLVSGKGNKLEQLPNIPKTNFLLIICEEIIQNKTSLMYSHIRPENFTLGNKTHDLKNQILNANNLFKDDLFNIFDSISTEHTPYVHSTFSQLRNLKIDGFHVSGTGPTVFTIMDSIEEAKDLKKSLYDKYKQYAILVQSHDPVSKLN